MRSLASFVGLFGGHPFCYARQQRRNCCVHFVVGCPILLQEFTQHVDSLQANFNNFGTRRHRAITELANQICEPVRHGAQPSQTNLSSRSFYCMNRAEEPVEPVGARIRFER